MVWLLLLGRMLLTAVCTPQSGWGLESYDSKVLPHQRLPNKYDPLTLGKKGAKLSSFLKSKPPLS